MSIDLPAEDEKWLDVAVAEQCLRFMQGERELASYAVSTAKNGTGQQNGSECTPLGWHLIRARIGQGAIENSVFVGRRFTGEIYSDELARQHPGRDWILTRIMWLSGLEKGKNRGGEVDTMRRYIYIHGCPDSDSFAAPSSHGCIKMRNKDIIVLFDDIEAGTRVYIHE